MKQVALPHWAAIAATAAAIVAAIAATASCLCSRDRARLRREGRQSDDIEIGLVGAVVVEGGGGVEVVEEGNGAGIGIAL